MKKDIKTSATEAQKPNYAALSSGTISHVWYEECEAKAPLNPFRRAAETKAAAIEALKNCE